MPRGLEYLDGPAPKYRSIKQKLDKNVFCKKNLVAPKTFGHHIYEGGNFCKLCNHLKKDKRKRYY